ncbi:MAG: family 20 glycosylhydrolase [Zhenhengia sp.]|jgi:hexosaminidase|uniref:family 20 glycosylhydrolase n=1 Tax=Zhenhengia sp. TaxID=2944208 RepID=UPI002914DC34|nr:family 20 glycosylhydrolase [Clostridiales bacterium]MDU6973175.1 family 20 glycosylhydrolase [Clostridiales bacterium]
MKLQEQLQKVVEHLQVRPITMEDIKVPIPTVPEGIGIEFLGADYKQIIDDEGNIHKPLVNSKVIIDFRIFCEEEEVWTKGIEVTVPGSYGGEIGENSKPYVIPEIKEWIGLEGQCLITSESTIRVGQINREVLLPIATILKQDMSEMMGLDLKVEIGGKPKQSDIYLQLGDEDRAIGEEGYLLHIRDYIALTALSKKGAFYATRTLLQILQRQNNSIPQGIIRDYPRYKKRGFMLDVGRRFSSMEALRQYVKLMAWYKMNDFQIHLNDNEIHFDDTKWRTEYAAFRLECDIYKGLAAEDGYYTKKEFGELIDFAKEYGVDIVPEIDTPAHSLAFVQYDETLALGPGKGRDHLNIMKEDTYTFVDDLFEEYMRGDEPTFRFQDVHIGTDEYFGTHEELEAFRAYTDRYLRWIKSKGRTPRLWGNLSSFKGKTPVLSEGVIINIWSLDWVDAIEMIKAGYDIINSDDTRLYIVPNADYYRDYLDKENLFNQWEPNMFRDAYTIPAGHPRLLGGAFSIWNDKIAIKISENEIYGRAKEGIQVLSQKLWNKDFSGDYNQFNKICKEVDTYYLQE